MLNLLMEMPHFGAFSYTVKQSLYIGAKVDGENSFNHEGTFTHVTPLVVHLVTPLLFH